MMPFRIHHYLFGVLHSHWKQHPDKPLPPVYALLLYHGSDTPYPYSLNLLDCFEDHARHPVPAHPPGGCQTDSG